MKSYDVIVIGGGLAGLMSALALSQTGRKIAIWEAKTCAQSASAGLLGALAPHMPEHWHEKKEYQFQSMQMAREFWPYWEVETALRSGYQSLGRWQSINSQADLAKAQMREEAAQSAWRGVAQWRVKRDAQKPFVNARFGVIEDTLSAQIFPREAVRVLKRACEMSGVEIFEHLKVLNFGQGWVEGEERWHADAIVLAGGYAAWPFLRPFLGAEFGEGIKGQAALLALDADWPYPMLTGDGFYIVPHSPRVLGVGSTSERYWSSDCVDENLDALLARVGREIELPQFSVLERWSGIRPRAYRPDPLIGEISAGIYINAGGFKTGYSFMNKLALDLAEMVDGREVAIPKNFDVRNHLLS